MSFVDRFGVQVVRPRRKREQPDSELAKDMAVIGYRSQGMTFREIGAILNVSRQAIHRRWKAIPGEARKHYGRRRTLG